MPRQPTLSHAPRTVIGYHGCSRATAERVIGEQRFLPSIKEYDWLGEGAYFWEYAPYRAREWAVARCLSEGGEPAVIRATIKLGRCLNLLDIEHEPSLMRVYESLVEALGEDLPRNTERGAHYLDRLVIDALCQATDAEATMPVQTVRGSFAEGDPIYPGSKILNKAHTQIAVRDTSCITRLSLVKLR
jgi:hypothetical protein